MIEIENITKSFNGRKVLDDITTSFKPGEVVAVIGPSGGGKSTFLRLINQLETQDSGEIKINGITLTSDNIIKMRQKIGMVFQNFNLFPHLSVIENITCALTNVKNIPLEEALNIAMEKLAAVGLAHKAQQMPKLLSGGEKQRVAIARAIAIEPEILLFDEPTSALDPKNVKEIIDLVGKIVSKNTTVIFVTHEMYFMKAIASRIVLFEHGKITADMPKDEFLASELEHIQNFITH